MYVYTDTANTPVWSRTYRCQRGSTTHTLDYITSNDPNQIEMAKNLSVVQPFPQFPDVTSCAGYITVDQATGSNLFFCFIKATVDSRNAPVLLALNGGPGITSLQLLFDGLGPFYVDSDQNLVKNNCSSNTKFNIIYLDVPAGAGYSYTNSYAQNDSEVGKQIHTFLLQFFTLFNEYSANDFYIMGESYGGKFTVETSLIIMKNKNKDPIAFNFKGIVTLSGFLDPPNMNNADTLYCKGLINEVERNFLTTQFDIGKDVAKINKLAGLLIVLTSLAIVPIFIGQVAVGLPTFYTTFIQSDNFRERFHVGRNIFRIDQAVLPAQLALADTSLSPVTTGVETILNDNLKVCLMNGQRDDLVNPVSVSKFVTGLRWHGAAAYNVTPRLIWTAPNETIVSGYVTRVLNMWEIMVSNADHGVVFDQPCHARDAIERFIHDEKFPGTTPVIPPLLNSTDPSNLLKLFNLTSLTN